MTPKIAPALAFGKSELMDWIAAWISRELKFDRGRIDGEQTFVRYGMDSVHAMMLVGDLEERLKRRLSPTLAWDFPTVEKMASYLAQEPVGETPARETDNRTDDAGLLGMLDQMSEEEIDRLLKERLGQQ